MSDTVPAWLPCPALSCPCCAEIWLNNIRYAMIEQLLRPRPGFEAPVRAHFRLLRWRIMRQCAAWMEQAQALDPLFQVRCSTACTADPACTNCILQAGKKQLLTLPLRCAACRSG